MRDIFYLIFYFDAKLAFIFGLRLIPGRNSLLYCLFRVAEATVFQ